MILTHCSVHAMLSESRYYLPWGCFRSIFLLLVTLWWQHGCSTSGLHSNPEKRGKGKTMNSKTNLLSLPFHLEKTANPETSSATAVLWPFGSLGQAAWQVFSHFLSSIGWQGAGGCKWKYKDTMGMRSISSVLTVCERIQSRAMKTAHAEPCSRTRFCLPTGWRLLCWCTYAFVYYEEWEQSWAKCF